MFKGHSLPKDSEEYLASIGLKNALYTIKAADMRPDLFGSLVPCTFHVWCFINLLIELKSLRDPFLPCLYKKMVGNR